MLCKMQYKADDRMNTYTCSRPDAALVRTTCPRAGHVEDVWLCRRCTGAVLYCLPCFTEDRILCRTSLLMKAG